MDETLVTDLARAMLDRAAVVEPERVAAERRVFDTLRTAYFADPERTLASGDRGSGQLKFGLPGVEVLLTPLLLLLAAAAEVVAYLGERGATATRAGVRRLLGRSVSGAPSGEGAGSPAADDAESVAALTSGQWAEVRNIVSLTLVRHARMPQQRAELIASAVVGEGFTGNRQE